MYFGKTEEDLKNFALRDLGIMRTNKATSFRARFTDGEEARACFHYSQLLDRIEVKSIGIYQGAVGDILEGPSCPNDYAADLRSRAIVVRHFAGDRIADFLRISIGTDADNDRLIEALHQLLR